MPTRSRPARRAVWATRPGTVRLYRTGASAPSSRSARRHRSPPHPPGPTPDGTMAPVGRWSHIDANRPAPWRMPDGSDETSRSDVERRPARPGGGRVTAATTGVFRDLPISWASRIGEPRRDHARRSSSPRPTPRVSRWPARTCSRRPGPRRRALAVAVDVTADKLERRLDGDHRPRSRSAATSRARPRSVPGRRPRRRRTAARSRGRWRATSSSRSRRRSRADGSRGRGARPPV